MSTEGCGAGDRSAAHVVRDAARDRCREGGVSRWDTGIRLVALEACRPRGTPFCGSRAAQSQPEQLRRWPRSSHRTLAGRDRDGRAAGALDERRGGGVFGERRAEEKGRLVGGAGGWTTRGQDRPEQAPVDDRCLSYRSSVGIFCITSGSRQPHQQRFSLRSFLSPSDAPSVDALGSFRFGPVTRLASLMGHGVCSPRVPSRPVPYRTDVHGCRTLSPIVAPIGIAHVDRDQRIRRMASTTSSSAARRRR